MTRLLPFVVGLVITSVAFAQKDAPKKDAKASAKPAGIPPTKADVAYGTHPRQVLDFFEAKADSPTPVVFAIHGGGWVNGRQEQLPGQCQAFSRCGHLRRRDQLSVCHRGDRKRHRAAGEVADRGRRAGVAVRPLEREGVEPRQNADRRDRRLGRRLLVALARCTTTTWPTRKAPTQSPANRRG